MKAEHPTEVLVVTMSANQVNLDRPLSEDLFVDPTHVRYNAHAWKVVPLAQELEMLRPSKGTEAARDAKAEVADLTRLNDYQRGLLIISACQAAMAIEHGKMQSGLPPSQPSPWPKSTWEFLKKSTRDARKPS